MAWINNIEEKIFSYIKRVTYPDLSSRYPGIFYTTSNELTRDESKKYTIYIHIMSGTVGKTMEKEIPDVLPTIECQVTTTTSRDDSREIANRVVDALEEIGITPNVAIPTTISSNGMNVTTTRFRKRIGSEDLNKLY